MDVNGMTPSTPSQPGKKCTSYKLLDDPNIKKNCQKLVRYDGVVSGQMSQQHSVKFVKDPRSRLTRLWRDVEVADLPIPKMKFDKYYVGELPPKQIMFTNLNDNVREPFLRSMVEKYGKVEDLTIHRHPKTSKHLGLASVTYTSTRSAKQAAMEMNRTSVMGKIIIVQIDAGGKECQRMVECLVSNKPSTPSSISSTPRIDPRNGTPMSAPDTPRQHNDPRRLSLERSSSVAPDTPASSISSSTPGFMPPETQGSFPAFTEQPVHQFQGIPAASNPKYQMLEQPTQQDMLMQSMNSVTLQGYEHLQKVYAAQQAAQQAGYTQQHIEQTLRTPTADMYAQQTSVQVQKAFTMPQTPTVPAVPDPNLLYGHQQHSAGIPQESPAVNFQATQPYQTSSLNVQGFGAHELKTQNQTEIPGYKSGTAADNSKQYQKPDHAPFSKKQNYMSRSESHHVQSEDSQASFQSRSVRGQRHSNQSGSKRYDNDRLSKRYDEDKGSKRYEDDRSSKRYEDDRHDHRDDCSKKWDRRDRQDYRSNKRNDRQRYRSQDYSEDDEDGRGYRQKDHRHVNYRSKDPSERHYDDSYHRKPYHKKEDEEEEHESGRGYKGGYKSRGYDKKYSDSRTYRDDQRDRKKPRDLDKEDVDYFAKWRCPTMKEQEIKPKEESSKFDKWESPTGKILPPEPVRETSKFDQCHPPGEEPTSISPEEISPFEEWQCPPGEEPPPGTMPLVLPSQPFPPGVMEEPLPNINADKSSISDAEETDDFALSLDTRIEKLLKSSQGPMAGFPGIQLEDSGNAGKNSSTTGSTLPPPGTEEPTFSQSEESVRTSDPETNTNYMQPGEQWGRYRQEQPPRTEQVDPQWAPAHLPHSHVPDPIQHPRFDHLKVSSNGNDAYSQQRSTPTPPGAQSASATPPPGKGVEMLISKQLAQLRNYDQQSASRDTSPISDLLRDRSQTSTPGIEDYHQMMHRGAMQYTPMDTAADDDDDKMSLSSLSSGEDTKIVVNVPIPEKKPQTPRVNSMPYSTSQASWNSNLNQRSTNVVNAWAAQMMPPSSAASSQMTRPDQAQTSGYRPNPMFPRGPPPSLPGMAPEATMEAFVRSMGLPSTSQNNMLTPAQMIQMMASMGMPPPSIGPDGLPDVKPEQLANFPRQLNLNSQNTLPFNMPPEFPAGSMPPWAAAPFMPPIPDSLLPSSVDKPQRDPEKELVNEVLKTVIQEMKIIMKRDLNRKMVENKAFKSFESWWDTCQLMAKAKDMMKEEKEEEKVHKKPPPAIPSMLESSLSSSFGMEGLGLGLRANMPRMPSFKVKRKPASPPPKDEIGDEDDDVEAKDKKRPVTPPVLDEDSDEMSDTEQDEITEISSQTSEPHVLDRRERAKRARDLIYSSSSDEDEDEEDKDVEVEKDLEEDDDDDEDYEEEEDEEEDDEEEEEEEEEEDEDEEEVEDEIVIKDAAKKKLEKTSPLKSEVIADDSDKEEESLDTQESETPSKLTADKPSLSEASDVESDEDWSESSSSSETESSSSESDSAESDSEEDDTEGKASDAKKTTGDDKEDRLGAFEILVEMATKAKDKLDQSSSDTDKGTLGDMELSDIQAAQSLQALRHASEASEVGEMTAFKGDTSATADDSSEKTLSGSEGELDVGDYKMMLMKQPKVVLEPLAIVDHTYCQKPTPSPDKEQAAPASEELKKQEVLSEKTTNLIPEVKTEKEKEKEEKQRQKAEKKKARKRKNELAKILEEEVVIIPEPKVPEFKVRNYYEEWTLLYEFLRTGISHEDAYLIRKSYETLLEAGNFPWLSYTHWMAHPLTSSLDPPQAKKKKMDEESRVHLSCSARTEGYYKISNKEKVKYLTKARTYVQESVTDSSALDESTTKKRIEVSRDARSDQRRFIAVLQQQEEQVSALFKFNQLQFRKKDLKFCKSSIHGWGLYAMEPIAADEMVIEYVGESVRQSIADSREKNYEKMGIGSSYLFRIDAVTIIDATKSGNLARFINHSCNPNCYAKIITVESQKKIVIYSKQTINVGDEITYDYKFPIEDEKIPCLCGAAQCRGTLN